MRPENPNNLRATIRGTTRTITEWSRLSGIKRTTLRQRFVMGWPPERLLIKPIWRGVKK